MKNILALVGRPNTGTSTLFNRLTNSVKLINNLRRFKGKKKKGMTVWVYSNELKAL